MSSIQLIEPRMETNFRKYSIHKSIQFAYDHMVFKVGKNRGITGKQKEIRGTAVSTITMIIYPSNSNMNRCKIMGMVERQKMWMKGNECELSFDDIAHLCYVGNKSFILWDDKKATATEKQELLALSTKFIIVYEMNIKYGA